MISYEKECVKGRLRSGNVEVLRKMDYRKAYVAVNLDVDEEGIVSPRSIRWRSGRVFAIDEVKYRCRANSEVGGGGIRYTVSIAGRETFLFNEGKKWFVEEKS